MIKQTYCSKDLCLKLEKKGIEASHVIAYEKGKTWYKKYTLDVVCKWLREVYNLYIVIVLHQDVKDETSEIDNYYHFNVSRLDRFANEGGDCVFYNSYDKAVSAAIEYCVDNLI